MNIPEHKMKTYTIDVVQTVELHQTVVVEAESADEAFENASRCEFVRVLESETMPIDVWPEKSTLEPLELDDDAQRLFELRDVLMKTVKAVDDLWSAWSVIKNSSILGTLSLALMGAGRTLSLIEKVVHWAKERA